MGFVRARGQNDVVTNFLLQREEERRWERQQQSSMHALLSALSPTVRPLFGDGASPCSPAIQRSKESSGGNQGLLQMSVEDVGQALITLKLGRYVQSFQDQQIDGAVLAHLNNEGLQQLGMNEQLHRSIFLGFVSKKSIGLDTS